MKQLTHTIKDELGLHARPAGLLVKLCASFESDIEVSNKGKTGNGKKIFSIMGLGAKCGEELGFAITGSDEEAAAEALEKFLTETL